MNGWQEWVVALLLVLCAVRIVRGLFSFGRRGRHGSPCSSCTSVCDLKRAFDSKQAQCGKSAAKGKGRKKCCCG